MSDARNKNKNKNKNRCSATTIHSLNNESVMGGGAGNGPQSGAPSLKKAAGAVADSLVTEPELLKEYEEEAVKKKSIRKEYMPFRHTTYKIASKKKDKDYCEG